ncbi:hypothetical protein [Gordonia sp. NB41Y]|uniref:hypothetical protein n=1 Tax=Gordonia sp. NB41Y TaxID=875808 RepID=UPI00128F2C54|nr:hypothetical protein [Gordonia sp. NB41Y]WLP89925.1 hypothetical protein Q9K23_20680 [Gordonia sp. NB41Y]
MTTGRSRLSRGGCVSIRVAVLGVALALGSGAGVAVAQADPYVPGGRDARITDLPSVAYGPACGGVVTAFAHTTPQHPDAVEFAVAGGFFGISGTGRPCSVTATIGWHNLTTGAHGTVSGPATGNLPGLGENQSGFARTVRTGRGTVRFTLTTDRPHLPRPAADIRTY